MFFKDLKTFDFDIDRDECRIRQNAILHLRYLATYVMYVLGNSQQNDNELLERAVLRCAACVLEVFIILP